MGYFFTDFFRQQLFANQNLMNNASIRLVFFRQAPSLAAEATQWAGYKTKAELHALSAWQELEGIAGYPFTNTAVVSKREIDVNNYVMFNTPYPFATLAQGVPVAAIGVEFVGSVGGTLNPLIFVTDTPTAGGTNVAPGDSLTANPDTDNIPDASNRYLFAWADPAAGATTVLPNEGPLTLLRAAPLFEPSNTLHVWMYPQRTNMIANPSFELDAGYWAPAPARVAGGAPNGGAWAGKFAGGAIESNIWPTRLGDTYEELWTFQLMAKGNGQVKVGLISWDADYRGTQADWGDETWELQSGAWVHIACVRYGPQAFTAMLRIECDGTEITIDKVLAERGALKEWPYFDGDEKYGSPDAFSWYGGSQARGKSYSMWYGDRRAVMGRLFATPVVTGAPGDLLTDTEVSAAGMVYGWVPAGVAVIPHIDVLYPNDLRTAPPTRSATVLPYGDGDDGGVVNPWV